MSDNPDLKRWDEHIRPLLSALCGLMERTNISALHTTSNVDEEGYAEIVAIPAAQSVREIIEFIDPQDAATHAKKWREFGISNLQGELSGFFDEIEKNAKELRAAIPSFLTWPYTDPETNTRQISPLVKKMDAAIALLGKLTPEDRELVAAAVARKKWQQKSPPAAERFPFR